MTPFQFIKNSLQKEISQALENQSDFIIQKTVANKIKDIDTSLIDEFYEINGVSKVTQRVYGQYYFMPENIYFTIIGIDFFEETTNKDLKELLNFLNISKFLEKDSMIIGNGVKKVLDKYAYFDSYDFKLENENSKNIKIFKDLPKEANLVANDLIIMDINIAKRILDIKPDFATDIIFDVPNPLERQNIKEQILLKESNIRILQKDELKKEYENMFNYKVYIYAAILYIIYFNR